MEIRTAIVHRSTSGYPTPEAVARYLPGNYAVLTSYSSPLGDKIVIQGSDYAGWTLEDYVIPRLASGLIYCAEIITEEAK